VLAFFILAYSLSPRGAAADGTIKRGSATHDYFMELEPHAVLTPFWPPRGSADAGLGAGAWFLFNLAPRGLLDHVNDSFALGVGFDYVRYIGGPTLAAECAQWSGSGEQRICVRTTASSGAANYFYVPIVGQWNFYFTSKFSAFAELGLASYFWSPHSSSYVGFSVTPVVGVGGRWHFSKPVSLTFRVAYPYTTVGLSFWF
jgi:hypothetical protein